MAWTDPIEPDSRAPPILSAIISSKGRLHHLKRSLPLLDALAGIECIMVDYACPDAAGDWVAQAFPHMHVVRARETGPFCIARARNLGAAAARSEWLLFVDADVLIDPGLLSRLDLSRPGPYFLVADPCPHELAGFVACRRAAFQAIGGYDELFANWGSEDRDFYARLQRSGCERAVFDAGSLAFIQHGDDERTRYHAIKDRFLAQRINAMYYQIKTDLARQAGVVEIGLTDRQAIYAQVQQLVLRNPHSPARMEISLPWTSDFTAPAGWRLRRSMHFQFEPCLDKAPHDNTNSI